MLRLFIVLFSVTSLGSVSLQQAFESTLAKNPAAELAQSRTAVAEEKANQSLGAILPRISGIGTYTRQDSPPDSGSGTLSRTFTTEQSTARITAVQPLFRGMGEWALLRAANATVDQRIYEERKLKADLFSRTATVFYGVLGAQQDLKNIESIEKLSSDRLKEIQGRVQVGRNRRGDLLSAEAQQASVTAQVEQSENALKDALDAWVEVTGLAATELPVDQEAPTPTIETLESYLALLEKRPDIQAAKTAANTAEEGITVAQSGHLPSLDLTGNYYLKRDGLLADVKWDVGLQLTVPLFAGGSVQAAVRENAEIHKQAELELDRLRRESRRQITGFHHSYLSSTKQLAAFERALKLAEVNYREQSKDYRFGLVNNLEVLQALTSLQDARRNRDKTLYQSKTLFAQLQASVGKTP